MVYHMYEFLPYNEAKKYEGDARKLKVSQTARDKGGWWYELKAVKGDFYAMPDNLINKRRGFIARTLAQYIKNPTKRRWLSLIMWNYWTDPIH